MVNRILFFIPGQEIIINLLRVGSLASYTASVRSAEDLPQLEALLDQSGANREQLVFVGTERRTGIKPSDLAALIKQRNPKALVILSSVTEQEWVPPLDGFVLLSRGQEIRALADVTMSRA